MSKTDILHLYEKSGTVSAINETLANRRKVDITGLTGSSLSFVITALFHKSDLPFLLLFNDKEEAAYYLNDLETLINKDDVFRITSYNVCYTKLLRN